MTELGALWFDPSTPAFLDRGRGRTIRLEPGKFYEHKVILTRYYDMTRPGTYVVQAKWNVVANGGRLSLLQFLSNKLEHSILREVCAAPWLRLAPPGYRLSPTEAVSNKLVITVDAAEGIRPRSPKGGPPPF